MQLKTYTDRNYIKYRQETWKGNREFKVLWKWLCHAVVLASEDKVSGRQLVWRPSSPTSGCGGPTPYSCTQGGNVSFGNILK